MWSNNNSYENDFQLELSGLSFYNLNYSDGLHVKEFHYKINGKMPRRMGNSYIDGYMRCEMYREWIFLYSLSFHFQHRISLNAYANAMWRIDSCLFHYYYFWFLISDFPFTSSAALAIEDWMHHRVLNQRIFNQMHWRMLAQKCTICVITAWWNISRCQERSNKQNSQIDTNTSKCAL